MFNLYTVVAKYAETQTEWPYKPGDNFTSAKTEQFLNQEDHYKHRQS